ncbi:HEAT repeat domain-containing protein [bacterium]|nr:MAG: HEAT repeat domain-containing protein [bacterium]
MKIWLSLSLLLATVCPARAFVVGPPSSLDNLSAESDLVFKGVALDSSNLTDSQLNAQGFGAQQTRFRVVSVLKGPSVKEVAFRSYRKAEATMFGWHPQFYQFQPNAPYIVWAKKGTDGLWRQTSQSYSFLEDEGAMRAGDTQPVGRSTNEVVWREWNLLLASKNSADVIYALSHIATFSGSGDAQFMTAQSFKPQNSRRVATPYLASPNPQIAQAAIKVLQVTGAQTSSPGLIALALSPADPETRAQAVAVLKGVKTNPVRLALTQLLATPQQPELVQAAALNGLGDWNDHQSRADLLRFARSNSPRLRASTAKAIGELQTESLLPALFQLTHDADKSVNETALSAFANSSGSQMRPYFEKLRRTPKVEPLFTVLLAQSSPEKYLPDLERIVTSNLEVPNISPQSTVYMAWHALFDWLQKQPPSAWQKVQTRRIVKAMESGPEHFWGSSEPEALYKLLRQKNQEKEARKFRAIQEKTAGYDIAYYFRRADEELARQKAQPHFTAQ